MSKQITLPLLVMTQRHVSGFSVSRLAGDLLTLWPNEYPSRLAGAFQRSAQINLVEQHELVQLLSYCDAQQPLIDRLQIKVPANDKRFDQDEHVIELDFTYCEYKPGRWFGYVPAVDAVNFATSVKQLRDRLEETVLLEFYRNKRLKDHAALVAVQWYKAPEISEHKIDLTILTPAELLSNQTREEELIVPKTASSIKYARNPAIGLQRYTQELHRNILGDYRQSVLVVGPNGSGKTALINEFFRLHQNDFTDTPWHTTAARMLRVLTENGSWQYGLGQWVTELRKSSDVVYIGKVAELFEVGQYAGNSISIGDALREPLQRNEITLIGELTEEQLEKIDLRSPGYSQLFHILRFDERKPEEEDAIAVQAVSALAADNDVEIERGAIERILSLQRRYTPYSGYPGKTIHFFESLLIQQPDTLGQLNLKDAVNAFCAETGMPEFLVDDNVSFSPVNATEFFAKQVIGQRNAIDEVVSGITTVKTRMARSGKPIFSGLFVGPTGVGKTEIVKTMSHYIFGDRDRMVRLDMSEYSDVYSVLRLTAANEAGLVTKVRQQPFAVVLLDEIEKAHASVFDLLLQVLDEGRLTDDRGEVANFCSTIIIMTSNIGAQEFAANRIGFTEQSDPRVMQAHFDEAVRKHFRPELVNRIDLVVPFVPLTSAELLLVVRKELAALELNPGIVSRAAQISIDDSVYEVLANKLLSSKYGARAVQRIIQQHVIWPLSRLLCTYPETEPLRIQLSVEGDRVSVTALAVADEKKRLLSLIEVADDAARLRKDMQALENGSTWIGLLSRLDQLDAIMIKQKEKFWQNPEWFNEYETHRQLTESLANCLNEIYDIEEQALGYFRNQQEHSVVDMFRGAITASNSSLLKLLVQLDSVVRPDHNEAVLSFYGRQQSVKIVEQHYRECLQKLGIEPTMLYHYVVTADNTENNSEHNTETSSTRINGGAEHDAQSTRYLSLAEPSTKRNYLPIGKAFVLSGPAVALYFFNERGIWKLALKDGYHSLFVDLHMGDKKNLNIPADVHRKQFYSNKKPARHVTQDTYNDKRMDADPLKLSNHAETMAEVRTVVLRLIHLPNSSAHADGSTE